MAEALAEGLVGLVDALLDSGAAVAGDVTIGVADVDLVAVNLRLLVTGVQAHLDRGAALPASREHPARPPAPPLALPARIDTDPARADAGLGRLILFLAQLLHQVVEHQAVARLEGGSLTPQQQETVGQSLMAMDARLNQLRELFASNPHDVSLLTPSQS